IVENCFKHGIKGETASSFVDIGIYINDGTIALSTKNNIGMVDSVERSKSSGTGLGNLKQRLELIYPEKHQLKIVQKDNIYAVSLNIEL
ncbi:MAG: sensor histidine kinase, partial [Bacteroidota bacterium]